MKTKIMLLAALLSAAALSANAGVRFGVSFGFPAPMVVSRPVVDSPSPVTVVQTTPPCPVVDYVWAPGHGSVYPTGRVWVSGAWHTRPARVLYGPDRDYGHDRDRQNGNNRHGHDEYGHEGYRR